MSDRNLFVFGFGYSAGVLAARLIADGWTVAGTARSEEGQARMREAGVAGFAFDRARPLGEGGLTALSRATHVLSSVPPDEEGDPVIDLHGDDLSRRGTAGWLGYLSTTGVYGDTGGAWVDEAAPTKPSSPRSARRVAAEAAWLALGGPGRSVQVFRLAGIYGPGRSPFEQLRAGTARRVDKPGHRFSRIHVEDIASVLEASIERPAPGAIYNVCDDRPAVQEEVVRLAAELLGVEPPPLVPFEQAEMSDMARSFWADNRRVRNERIKRELGVCLKYPDFEAGLRAILSRAA